MASVPHTEVPAVLLVSRLEYGVECFEKALYFNMLTAGRDGVMLF